MEVTGGDGVGRLLECTGAEYMVNNCFSLLRYTVYFVQTTCPPDLYTPFIMYILISLFSCVLMSLLYRKGGYIGMIGLPKVRVT